MRLVLCGVRGSTPAPGRQFVRYGGHTPCVAVAHDGEPPALVLDAGTGIRCVADLLDGVPFRGTVLLGHLHWDHTQGLPFFGAGDTDDAAVKLLMPAQGNPVDVLERMISPPFFPVRPRELRGEWRFAGLEPGNHRIEGFDVRAVDIPHKGGRMFGYRITDGSGTIAYMSDHSPVAAGPGDDGLGEYHPAARRLATDVDLLLHDAQHTAAEFPAVASFGHSAVEYAVGLARACEVRRLVLFHHSPSRTDDELDALVGELRAAIPVEAASEGAVFEAGSAGAELGRYAQEDDDGRTRE